MNADRLLELYERVADAPDAISCLRRFVLDLAVRGKLVAQDSDDKPASELLKQIAAEKARLVKAGEIRKPKPLGPLDEPPFEIPSNWAWTQLGTIAAYIQRGKSPKYALEKGTPVVSQKCVQWSGLDLDAAKLVTTESLAKYEPIRFLREGDLLWNSTGTGTIGRAIRLSDPPPKLVCDSHVTVVRCLVVDPEYVRTWLRTDHVYGVIEERAAGSTNQIELTAQMANRQPIPLPPLAEQRQIVAKVEGLIALLDRLEAARTAREVTRDRLTAASLARLTAPNADAANFSASTGFTLASLTAITARSDQIKQLRQTILNLAVRGKLVPQEASDEPASELLKQIALEKARMVKAGIARRETTGPTAPTEQHAFPLPSSWSWVPATFPAYGISVLDKKVQTKEVLSSGAFPVVDQGKVIVRGYCDDPEKVIRVAAPMIVFGDHTRETKLIDFDFVVGADGVKLLQPIGIDATYYFLALQWLPLDSRGYGRHFKLLKASSLPLPPLAEQHRIVAKVDALMALCDRLETALTTADTTRQRLLEALLHQALNPASEMEAAA